MNMSEPVEKSGKSTVSVIPARGGSKGVPKKNIKLLAGFPLIAYSVAASKLSSAIERTIVSTDSREIADIALSFGAEVPFLRPAGISQDNSTDLELFRHVIGWFAENENPAPEFLVHIRPTTPLRLPSEIDRAISCIRKCPDASSLRSAHELPEPPQKMFQINTEGFWQGFFPDDPRQEYYNLPRQAFPKAYHPNGHVDIVRSSFIQRTGLLHGPNILAYVTDPAVEVDTAEQFDYLEYRLGKDGSLVYDYLVTHFSGKD